MESEQVVWEGRPSPMEHLGTFIACGLFVWLVVPAAVAVWRYLEQISIHYSLTNERLKVRTGVLSKRQEELELYRVKDTSLEIPFFLRLFGLAHVVLYSSDASHSVMRLRAIPDAERVRDQIRGLVEKRREAKGVRELDV